jgi:hypothetical protein
MMKNSIQTRNKLLTKFDDCGNESELSPQQLKAVDALVCGSNLTQAAEIADVSRQTLSTWFNHDAMFQSALGQRRDALWRASVVEMRSMVTDAIVAIREELKGEKRLQAAKMILELSGFTSATPIQKPDKGFLDDDEMPRIAPMTDAQIMELFRRSDESENN